MATHTGDLLSVSSGIIVQGCNAQGVMGAGFALQVKERYPGAFAAYRRAYEEGGLKVGQVIWHVASHSPKLAIANAITQEFYGSPRSGKVFCDYDGIEACFREVAAVARRHQLPVHYPKIGAGLAGGDWDEVSLRISRALAEVEHHLWLPPGPKPRMR